MTAVHNSAVARAGRNEVTRILPVVGWQSEDMMTERPAQRSRFMATSIGRDTSDKASGGSSGGLLRCGPLKGWPEAMI